MYVSRYLINLKNNFIKKKNTQYLHGVLGGRHCSLSIHWACTHSNPGDRDSGGGGGLVTKPCPTLATPWTLACQAPLSMEFSRKGYWSGLPFPSPGDLPNPGMESRSPALQADSLPSELWGECFRGLFKGTECVGEMAQCLLIVLDSSHFLSGIVSAQLIFLNLNFFFFKLFLFFFLFFKFYFIFKLYITVLVLPIIKMNLPQVYMCSPSWTLLSPPSPFHPSGSSQCTSPKHQECVQLWELEWTYRVWSFGGLQNPRRYGLWNMNQNSEQWWRCYWEMLVLF